MTSTAASMKATAEVATMSRESPPPYGTGDSRDGVSWLLAWTLAAVAVGFGAGLLAFAAFG